MKSEIAFPKFLRISTYDGMDYYAHLDDRVFKVIEARRANDFILVFASEFQPYGPYVGTEFYSIIAFPVEMGIGGREILQWRSGMITGTWLNMHDARRSYGSFLTTEKTIAEKMRLFSPMREFRADGKLSILLAME